MKKILLLGGTGPIGIHLMNILSNRGYDVYVTSRNTHKDFDNVHYIKGNAKDGDFMELLSQRNEKWDCIVDFMVYGTSEFEHRYCSLLSLTKQYVFLSSCRIYNECDIIKENSERLLESSCDDVFLGTDDYALLKAKEENILIHCSSQNWTIIRPYITFAENRFPLGVLEKETWLRRCLEKKDIAIRESVLNKRTTISYGGDVATFISKIVGNNESISNDYNIVDSVTVSWKDVLECYLSTIEVITGYRPKIKLVKNYNISISGALKNVIGMKAKFPNYQLIYDREYNRRFDNQKLKELIPDYHFTEWKSQLTKCVCRFATHPRYNYRDYKWDALQDRLTSSHTPISSISGVKNKVKYMVVRYLMPLKYMIEK